MPLPPPSTNKNDNRTSSQLNSDLSGSSLLGLGCQNLDLLLGDTLGEDGVVLGDLDLLLLSLSAFERSKVSTTLETLGGHETLDFGAVEKFLVSMSDTGMAEGVDLRLGVGLSAFSLGNDFTTDDELPDIVGLGQVEESSNLGGTLLEESASSSKVKSQHFSSNMPERRHSLFTANPTYLGT